MPTSGGATGGGEGATGGGEGSGDGGGGGGGGDSHDVPVTVTTIFWPLEQCEPAPTWHAM